MVSADPSPSIGIRSRSTTVHVSVVIATYNRKAMLERTLPHLLAQDYPATRYEIVVVADGSRDGTAEYVRSLRPSCSLEVIERERTGPAAARNAGVDAAAGDVVLFMDDDIRVTPQLVKEHARGHGELPGSRIQGAIFIAPESPNVASCVGHCNVVRGPRRRASKRGR